MSAYRDALDPETRARYDQAVKKAGRILAAALADLRQGGVPAAGQAA